MQTLDRNLIIEKLALDQGLWRQILSRVDNDVNLAEDVLQQVLIKVYEKIHQLKDVTRLYAWVYQIMKNEAAKLYQQMMNAVDLDCEQMEEAYEMQTSEFDEAQYLELQTILQESLEQDLFSEVEQQVAEILIDGTLQGLDHAGIVKSIHSRLGYNNNYIKALLSRVRKKLDQYLQRYGFMGNLRSQRSGALSHIGL